MLCVCSFGVASLCAAVPVPASISSPWIGVRLSSPKNLLFTPWIPGVWQASSRYGVPVELIFFSVQEENPSSNDFTDPELPLSVLDLSCVSLLHASPLLQ
mgnify:CR=1 FL=1